MNRFTSALLCILMMAFCAPSLSAAGGDYLDEKLYEMVETANDAVQDEEDPYSRVWLDDSRGELMLSMGFDPEEFPDLNDEDTYFRYKEFLMSTWLKSDFWRELIRLAGSTGRELRFVMVDKSTATVGSTVLFSCDEMALALMENSPGSKAAKTQMDEIYDDMLNEMVAKADASVRAEGSYNSVRIDDDSDVVVMSLLVGDIGLVPFDPEVEISMDLKRAFLQEVTNGDIGVDWSVFLNVVAATGHGLCFRLYESPGEYAPWQLCYSADDLFILGE